MNKIATSLKLSLAVIAGDTDNVIATKNYRKATAQIKGQLAALNSKIVDDEQQVEDAKEALSEAKYPNKLITDGKAYHSGIVLAQEKLDAAIANLKATTDSIAFNQALLDEFDKEIEA